MKLGGVILLALSALAQAGDRERVAELVRQLEHPDILEREAAQLSLEELGPASFPYLRDLETPHAEVRRALSQLLHSEGSIRMEARALTPLVSPGGLLELELVLHNESGSQICFPAGIKVSLLLRQEFAVDEDEIDASEAEAPFLPGGTLTLHVRLDGQRMPLRRPGKARFEVRMEAGVQVLPSEPEEVAQDESIFDAVIDPRTIKPDGGPLVVEVSVHTVEELAVALESSAQALRDAAVREISAREDERVLPLLREHGSRRGSPLRLAAVRALGTRGLPEDLSMVVAATKDPDDAVRRAATLGLGHFRQDQARRRLLVLAGEDLLQFEAVQALRGHPHAETISRFINLLKSRHSSEECVTAMLETLADWIDFPVHARATEIAAFERWWADNAATWKPPAQR